MGEEETGRKMFKPPVKEPGKKPNKQIVFEAMNYDIFYTVEDMKKLTGVNRAGEYLARLYKNNKLRRRERCSGNGRGWEYRRPRA